MTSFLSTIGLDDDDVFVIVPVGCLVIMLTLLASLIYRDHLKKQKRAVNKKEKDATANEIKNFQDMLSSNKSNDIMYGDAKIYKWSQNDVEVDMFISVPPSMVITKKNVKVNITSTSIDVILDGETLLSDIFYADVDPNECNWQLDDNGSERIIWITLNKKLRTKTGSHWRYVLSKDDVIKTTSTGQPMYALNPDDPNAIRAALASVS